MNRFSRDHISLEHAYQLGMTLSEWVDHEAACSEVDAKAQAHYERTIYAMLIGILMCAVIAILALGA